jgi:2-polyprenyl-3-methyl-5-hydroxy-6-metoxy-1,4-benzoquinol methylase
MAFMFMQGGPQNSRHFEKLAQKLLELVPPELNPAAKPVIRHVAAVETIAKHLPSGAVLDFGSGCCMTAALLALSGYQVSACDDLADSWLIQDPSARDSIITLAQRAGVDFFLAKPGRQLPYRSEQFDLVLASHVLEHIYQGVAELLCRLVEWLRPEGLLVIFVPNAVNLRKRIAVLFGSTNYPDYEQYFLDSNWRGHVREYVLRDLRIAARLMGLDVVELAHINMLVHFSGRGSLAKWSYRVATSVLPWPGLRDSLLLVARKPRNWAREFVALPRTPNLLDAGRTSQLADGIAFSSDSAAT